jgi:hypothetical protein
MYKAYKLTHNSSFMWDSKVVLRGDHIQIITLKYTKILAKLLRIYHF